ncbi:AAA family ATPase [Sphingomonas sp. HF-S3]|uniref:AAA family ATPase n=1 Tax=Sphingomonas rustica TaxID=3103142 RepID=A0ABV0BDU8_9SPHN
MISPTPEPRFHVITGGPGSGKSTLIDALRAAGHAVVAEAGRAVIREQGAAGGDALPWMDRVAFARAMLARDLAAFRDAEGETFFDRGIPDIQGYLHLIGEAPLAEVDAAVRTCRYAGTIFIAPPWREIFVQDAERRQDFAEACRTCDAMRIVYARAGYDLIELPLASVEARLAFVLDCLGGRQGTQSLS